LGASSCEAAPARSHMAVTRDGRQGKQKIQRALLPFWDNRFMNRNGQQKQDKKKRIVGNPKEKTP